MSKELPVIEAKELNTCLTKLAGEIIDLHLSATHKAKRCHDIGAEAVNDARLCGQKLEQAKGTIPHGEWKDWLKSNCPEISYETATRYIRVSKMSHVTDLSECTSLRQAYIECGILPAPEEKPTEGEPRQVLPVWQRCTTRLEKLVDELQQEERERLRQWCLETLKRL